MTTERTFHPVADAWPMMAGQAFQELKSDIGKHGVRNPIVAHVDGPIIDGRARYIACNQLGIEPPISVFSGTVYEIMDHCIGLNSHRRPLAVHQASQVAVRLANIPGVTIAESARRMRVSATSAERTKRIMARAVPELLQMFQIGDLSIAAAEELTLLEEEDQKREVAKGPIAARRASVELRNIRVCRSRADKEEAGEAAKQHGAKVSRVIELVGKVHEMSRLPENRFSLLHLRALTSELVAASEAAFSRKG
jgi:ParB-like chromosome segregation protein Spo0J